MGRKHGRKVILHCLETTVGNEFHQSFRFLDPKTREFLAPADASDRRGCTTIAEQFGFRVEWFEKESL